MYETFDHTADLGLRIRAGDLNTLFAEAGMALLAVLVENPDAVVPVRELEIRLPKDDLDYLLFDWLKTLLYHFETERLLCSRFDLRVADDGIHAVARGETFDPARHEPAHEVKAITYHDLKAEKTPEGWLAEVIVDI